MYQLYVDLLSARYQMDRDCVQKQVSGSALIHLRAPVYTSFIRKFGGSLVQLGLTLEGVGLPREIHPLSEQANVYLKEGTR